MPDHPITRDRPNMLRTEDRMVITSRTVDVRLTDADRTAEWTDDVNDDYGPGDYTHPTGDVFKAGVFDLAKVTLYEKGDEYRLIYRIDGPITNSGFGVAGYSLPLLQMSIREPDAQPDATSSIEGRTGTGITFGKNIPLPDRRR